MSSSKEKRSKFETKAGMLGKDYGVERTAETENKSADELEETPKISKEKAARKESDRPVH